MPYCSQKNVKLMNGLGQMQILTGPTVGHPLITNGLIIFLYQFNHPPAPNGMTMIFTRKPKALIAFSLLTEPKYHVYQMIQPIIGSFLPWKCVLNFKQSGTYSLAPIILASCGFSIFWVSVHLWVSKEDNSILILSRNFFSCKRHHSS